MNGFESNAAELGLIMMTDAARSGGTAADDIAELLRRSKAGDLAAFEQIIGLHERRVFRIARTPRIPDGAELATSSGGRARRCPGSLLAVL